MATKTPTKTKPKPKAKPAARKKAPSAAKPKAKTAVKKTAAKKAPNKTPKKVPQAVKLLTEAQIRKAVKKDYMNDAQLAFFRNLLMEQRQEVLAREVDIRERLNNRENSADPADRATTEEEHWLDLRLRDREAKLLRKIDQAIDRIKKKDYGYCEETGEEIGIPRLLARPTAQVCVDVKDHSERIEAQFRD